MGYVLRNINKCDKVWCNLWSGLSLYGWIESVSQIPLIPYQIWIWLITISAQKGNVKRLLAPRGLLHHKQQALHYADSHVEGFFTGVERCKSRRCRCGLAARVVFTFENARPPAQLDTTESCARAVLQHRLHVERSGRQSRTPWIIVSERPEEDGVCSILPSHPVSISSLASVRIIRLFGNETLSL